MSWHFPILLTIREMPFKNYRGRSSEKLKGKEDKIESQWPGPRLPPHLGNSGAQAKRVSVLIGNRKLIGIAQTRRVNVLIGSQPIGTTQKRARLRHGRHTTHGNEVIFIDPLKGIHGDENHVCL